ncbi:MAG: slipin family protein [Candidatus Sericytochromatia bacterium]
MLNVWISMGLIPFVCVLLFAASGWRVAQEYQRAVVFRLGRFKGIKGPGLYWNLPLLEWQRLLDMRTETVDIEQQETITKDSVTIRVNAVLWFRITHPERAVIAVANYRQAVYQAALTALRNIIGQHQLDEVLKERDTINATLCRLVDAVTQPWGVKVEMVEMKDVEIPTSMQRAMAREAEAVREKRARLIKAEAELESSVKLAQASELILANPAALELRRMQMIAEIGSENNTTTIVMLPSDIFSLGQGLHSMIQQNVQSRQAEAKTSPVSEQKSPGEGP